MKSSSFLLRPALTAIALAVAAGAVRADERESLESLRNTTLGLIEALVQSGVLPREKADALIAEARRKAAQTTASAAEATPAPATPVAGAKPVQRVPYIPESLRTQIRNEVKEEVLAQAREERWGVPNAPAWVDRIRIDGDIRVRHQRDSADKDNTPAAQYLAAEYGDIGRISRAPDFSGYQLDGSGIAVPTASTQDSRSRERIRLRLGLTAKITDEVGVGVRLATGNATDRVSTNQTLGQNFNKYQVFVDRAFVKLDPTEWLSLRAGRLPNPWFATEMIWSDNLNFEGVASTVSWPLKGGTVQPFATLGWFPIKEQSPGVQGRRSLWGAQVGSQFDLGSRTRVKLGLAYYRYNGIEGREDMSYTFNSTLGDYVGDPTRAGMYEYGNGLRQKGNTVFETNPASPSLDPKWGLAYRFAPLALTASAEFTHFSPFSMLLAAEYVRNTAFDVGDFQRRAGSAFNNVDPGGQRDGYYLKFAFGWPEVQEARQWQASVSYRHIGSDAVLDAFNDSDLGLGGTNLEGFALGFTYGLYRNTSVGVRYLSAKSIDPTINGNFPDARYNVNSLQVDLNVRF